MGALGPSGVPACTEMVATFMRRGLSPDLLGIQGSRPRKRKKAPGRHVRGLRKLKRFVAELAGGTSGPACERFVVGEEQHPCQRPSRDFPHELQRRTCCRHCRSAMPDCNRASGLYFAETSCSNSGAPLSPSNMGSAASQLLTFAGSLYSAWRSAVSAAGCRFLNESRAAQW